MVGYVRLSLNISCLDHIKLKDLCERKNMYIKDFIHMLLMREIDKDSKNEEYSKEAWRWKPKT